MSEGFTALWLVSSDNSFAWKAMLLFLALYLARWLQCGEEELVHLAHAACVC